jgi:hypothetical protein
MIRRIIKKEEVINKGGGENHIKNKESLYGKFTSSKKKKVGRKTRKFTI